MTQSVEDFFAGGVTAAKFEDRSYGTVIGGEIVDDPRMQQQRDYESGEPMTYPDGNPAMQMVIVVQAYQPSGDDDGRRAFYVKGQMRQAIGEALRKQNVKAPARGGRLWLRYQEDKPTTLKNGKPGNPQKIYAAKYEPPAQAAAGQFFGDPQAADSAPAAAPARTADDMRGTDNYHAERRQAVAGVSPAATQWPACPPGIDPAAWSRMTGDQRAQMYQALGLPVPQAEPVGGPAFRDEPPF